MNDPLLKDSAPYFPPMAGHGESEEEIKKYEDAEMLRKAKKCYSRAGFALCVMLLLNVLLPSIAVVFLELFGIELSVFLSYGLSALSLYAVAIPVFYLMIKSERRESPEKHRMSVGQLLTAFLLSFPLLYLGSWIGRLQDFFLSFFTGRENSNLVEEATGELGIGLTLLFVVLLAPFFEELIFRKLLLDRVAKYGYAPAAALSGLVFGLFHGNFLQFFYALFLGCFFAFLYLRTGKLRYTVILHMLVNFFGSIIPMLLQTEVPQGPTSLFMEGVTEAYGLLIMGVLIAGTIMLIARRRRFTMPALPGEIDPKNEHKLFLTPGVILFILLCASLFLLML